MAISQEEKPFDVFLCYKEADPEGNRTPDSVLAQEMYYALGKQGFRVFFARLSLEDKLGEDYEPYIFSALNSARVMVVVATRPEYVSAVWVKNEWSRYLALIKNGADKSLIPAYRDMDPYDLPEEFSHLQALDMGKLGFMQDLVHGITKMLRAGSNASPAAPPAVAASADNPQALLKRGAMALEDCDFPQAEGFFEKVLNLDAECAEAYMGKLLVREGCHSEESFHNQRLQAVQAANNTRELRLACQYQQDRDYTRALRFASGEYAKLLQQREAEVKEQEEKQRQKLEQYALAEKYTMARADMEKAVYSEDWRRAAEAFDRLGTYMDAEALAQQCRSTHEKVLKEWGEKEALEAAKHKKMRKAFYIAGAALGVVFLIYASVIIQVVNPRRLQEGREYLQQGQYELALQAIEKVQTNEGEELRKEIKDALVITQEEQVVQLYESGDAKAATALLMEIHSNTYYLTRQREILCDLAMGLYDTRDYENMQKAVAYLEIIEQEHRGVDRLLDELYNDLGTESVRRGDYKAAADYFEKTALVNSTVLNRVDFVNRLAWVGEGDYLFLAGEPYTIVELDGSVAYCIRNNVVYNTTIPYADETGGQNSWEHSNLRTWLNDTYYEETFSDFARLFILPTTHTTKRPDGGEETTTDYVFPMSTADYEAYQSFVKSYTNPYWLREYYDNGRVHLVNDNKLYATPDTQEAYVLPALRLDLGKAFTPEDILGE